MTASQSAYSLCTADNDQLGDSLLILESKKIGNKSMVLCRRINCKELKAYNVVFISSADNAAGIIRDSHGLSIVTVSDKPNFANQEGIIGSVLAPDNYRFSSEIYFDTAQAAYVHTSTRILQLAERVYTENDMLKHINGL